MSKDIGWLTADPSRQLSIERNAAPCDPWHELDSELDAWADRGVPATFWWRDDDACAPTPALDRLLALHATTAVPLSLAVVPQRIGERLVDTLAPFGSAVTALQHGYAHDNHAGVREKKAELVASRPTSHVLAELALGWQNLQILPYNLPILVPPWNRIASHLVPLLPEIGLTGLSTFGPRTRARPSPGGTQANTHIDPIAWRQARHFIGTENAVRAAVEHLRARRTHSVDADEPTGLLTHHLVMDEPTWRFAEHMLRRTLAHPAARWLAADDVFAIA